MTSETAEAVKTGEVSQELIELMSNEELLMAYKTTGDEQYKWPLVLRYKDLIKNAALQIRGVYNHLAQVDDIVSEGILTLVSAIDRYDPEKGVKFETFISKRIRGLVIDVARKQDWLPRSLRKRTREIDEAVTHLYNELGRCPNDTEVAAHLGVTVEKYHKEAAGVALGNILSLDALIDMREQDTDRLLKAEWTGEGGSYVVSIKITATENAPLLNIVSTVCAQIGLFVLSFNGRVDAKSHSALAEITVRLNKKSDLDELLRKLKDNASVIDVYRTIV